MKKFKLWLTREHAQKTQAAIATTKAEYDKKVSDVEQKLREEVATLRNRLKELEDRAKQDISHLQSEIEFIHVCKRDSPNTIGRRPVRG